MKDDLTLRIETVDGTIRDFRLSLDALAKAEYSAGSKFERFLNQQCISLHVGEELIVFPMHQIRLIRFSPVPHRALKWILPALSQVECSEAELATSH